jgi:hypothetical protein
VTGDGRFEQFLVESKSQGTLERVPVLKRRGF